VHEDVLALVLGGDEAEALGRVVPFHRAGDLLRGTEVAGLALVGRAPRPALRRTPAGAAEAAATSRGPAGAATTAAARSRRAGVDARDLRDLRTLLARRHAHRQTGAGLELAVARRLDRPDMQEGVSGSVAHLGKAESFLRVEPLDHSIDLRTGGRGGAWWPPHIGHGGGGEGITARFGEFVAAAEIAPARVTKISSSTHQEARVKGLLRFNLETDQVFQLSQKAQLAIVRDLSP
jgi:hypothetical protein